MSRSDVKTSECPITKLSLVNYLSFLYNTPTSLKYKFSELEAVFTEKNYLILFL